MIVYKPVRFSGTEEERRKNYATHLFFTFDEEIRCGACDCRPTHVAADYPCGVEPPRTAVEVN